MPRGQSSTARIGQAATGGGENDSRRGYIGTGQKKVRVLKKRRPGSMRKKKVGCMRAKKAISLTKKIG